MKYKKEQLTMREIEIMQLIAMDYPRKEIEDCLDISIRTVDAHIRSIHSKTNTKTFGGIASYYIKHFGMLSIPLPQIETNE